jgi:hypothetical protein
MDPSDGAETGCTMSKMKPRSRGANAAQASAEATQLEAYDPAIDGELIGDEDDGQGCLEAAAHTSGIWTASPEDLRAPEQFVPDLKRLRHYKSNGQEIDLLAHIEADEIAKSAVKRTGYTVEKILAKCTLIMLGGDSWSLQFPVGFINDKDTELVRMILCRAWLWWTSAQADNDGEISRTREAVMAEIGAYLANEKLAAERQRRSNAGKRSGMSPKRTKNLRQVKAVLRALGDVPSHEQIHKAKIRLENKGVALSESQIRKLRTKLEDVKHRKARTS